MISATLAARIAAGLVAALLSVRGGVGLYAWRVAEGLEKPAYEMLARLPDGVELREYGGYLVAESAMQSSGANGGFRSITKFIFGGNSAGEQMAMTAPVRTTGQSMSFVVPKKCVTYNYYYYYYHVLQLTFLQVRHRGRHPQAPQRQRRPPQGRGTALPGGRVLPGQLAAPGQGGRAARAHRAGACDRRARAQVGRRVRRVPVP